MKFHVSFAALVAGLCCVLFCLCSCHKNTQPVKTVSKETFHLMQKTQAELVTCIERCRSQAEESKDKDTLLALANSQQLLADRHETIISSLQKKYKFEKISTASYTIELDPRMLVLAPPDEYKQTLATANPDKTRGEVLIALEITNKVLEADQAILSLNDPDSEEGLDLDFYLCPVCGHLDIRVPEENCPVCNTDKEKIVKLKNGNLPPRKEESFIFLDAD